MVKWKTSVSLDPFTMNKLNSWARDLKILRKGSPNISKIIDYIVIQKTDRAELLKFLIKEKASELNHLKKLLDDEIEIRKEADGLVIGGL